METIKHTMIKASLSMALFASTTVFASISSGQLIIINGLASVDTSGNLGSTPSSVSVVVSDATGPCSTTPTLAYNGTVTVKWAASNTHSSTSCTSISSVAVTPLKTTIGSTSTIIYDSSTATTVPATTATSAITFTPPTTVRVNQALIINGSGVPASAVTASATAWGVGAAAAPVFDAVSGSLTTVGVPGAQGTYGYKAEQIMRQYAILPHGNFANNAHYQY